jgi:protein SCO1/2
MSSRWKILAPVIVILFPVLFWLLLIRGHNTFVRLPVVGPFEITAGGDTLYHTIPPFRFTNQEGKEISDKDLDGKIFVANFFFATCKTVCPPMNEQVHRLQEACRDINEIRFLSFTVDPANDTVGALAAYAAGMKADNAKWWFLTGNKDSIYDLARNGFLVPAAIDAKGEFFHSQDLLLIDKEKRMRGIYDGTEPAEVDTLIDEIKVLLHEYAGKKN